jgi:YjbE family integral membrane protein
MIEYLSNPLFWIGLGQIIVVNILLSGDNAVVIALAARSLPAHQQKQAIIWGSVAAIILRVILTIVAVEMLKLHYLKIIGGLLLFYIAIQLLVPEDDGEDGIESSSNVMVAIRTILIADLVMSLDNVIGVAAAAKGDNVLVILGLAISIPLIIFGSTLLLKLMGRFPVIITIGAALLGWVAGEMLITDPILVPWIATNMPSMEIHLPLVGAISWAQILGAAFVVAAGKVMAMRAKKAEPEIVDPATGNQPTKANEMLKLLVPLDGSGNSLRTINFVIDKTPLYKETPEIHLLNVQHPFPGTVRGVHEEAGRLHHDEGIKALAPARKLLDAAGIKYGYHIGVGEVGETVAQYVKEKKIDQVVMGTRGAGSVANMLLGSVATQVLHMVHVPVLLVK